MDLKHWTKVEENNILKNTLPEIFKTVEVTDGEILDTGYRLAGNWYLYKFSRTIGEITHWRYI